MEKEGKKGERNETEKKGESVKEEEVEKRKEKKRGTRKEGKGREGTSKERKKKKDEGKRREKEEEVDEKNGEEEIKKDLEIETPSKVAITLTLSDLIERVGMTEEALLQRIITLQVLSFILLFLILSSSNKGSEQQKENISNFCFLEYSASFVRV